MPLKIQTTGLEQYAPDGQATLKVMVVGGPGVGKTRFSSYWPKPLYLNCESGLASIADRKMPFVDINNSQDMLDALAYLKVEARQPYANRQFQTVVVDTLDAFQRKVKDEWLQANPGSQSFRGFDAWGYLDAKMQMLLTRLLNLPMNVIVLVHHKDKTIKEGTGEGASERQELQLQLSGDVKDTVFNDFDLVGMMATYFEAVDGQKVEKRGITFTRTDRIPFLKDRLNVTPKWMEVRFHNDDYANLFAAVVSRLDEFGDSEVVGEIPPAEPASARPVGGVVGPNSGGALPPADPKDVPLEQYDKQTLIKKARELGVTSTADGQPIRGNTIKAELIEAIRKHQEAAEKVVEPGVDSTPDSTSDASAASTPAEQLSAAIAAGKAEVAAQQPASSAAATPVQAASEPSNPKGADQEKAAAPAVAMEELAAEAAATQPAASSVDTEVGKVDPNTGEMTEREVVEALGGQVVSITTQAEKTSVAPSSPAAETPAAAPPAAAPSSAPSCAVCGKNTAGENQDYVKLSNIKYRAPMCNEHYLRGKQLKITSSGDAAVAAIKAAS